MHFSCQRDCGFLQRPGVEPQQAVVGLRTGSAARTCVCLSAAHVASCECVLACDTPRVPRRAAHLYASRWAQAQAQAPSGVDHVCVQSSSAHVRRACAWEDRLGRYTTMVGCAMARSSLTRAQGSDIVCMCVGVCRVEGVPWRHVNRLRCRSPGVSSDTHHHAALVS